MIRELSELGKKIRVQQAGQKQIHNALKDEPYTIDLVINEDGSFHKFEPIEKRLTQAEAIIAKKGKARLLLDKVEEVLAYPGKDGNEKAEKKHSLFLEKLNEYKNLPELKPVMDFYYSNKSNGIDKALADFEQAISEKERSGNIVFRLKTSIGKRIHEEDGVYKAIIEKYEKTEKLKLYASSKPCSICGTSDYPVEDTPHGMIKRVPDGQSSGCALVSYNENAFESYSLKGNDNSSICKNCATTYVEGMNWLMTNGNDVMIEDRKGNKKPIFKFSNRKNFGVDTAMVYWTRNNQSLKELDILEQPTEADVANLIDSLTSGDTRPVDDIEPDRFYSCTLSGAAARIAVRDWIETNMLDFKKSITRWFKDIAIEEFNFDLKKYQTHYSRLYNFAKCCQNENAEKDPVLSRTATYLWHAALKETALPLWILSAVLRRSRLENRGVTPDRAALIKLILNRSNKGGSFMVQERLKPGEKPIAYICGQIFAKLESIQYAALGERNAGIREKYFTYAMTAPSSAFGRLFNLNSKHFTKLKGEKPGLAVNMDKELQALCKDIMIENFPQTFTLEEQGQFAIGYYHQKQAQFSHSDTKQ